MMLLFNLLSLVFLLLALLRMLCEQSGLREREWVRVHVVMRRRVKEKTIACSQTN